MKLFGQGLARPLAWLERRLLAYPKLLILAFVVGCGFSLIYTIQNLGLNTDTTQMLSPDLPFQQDRKRLIETFPQDDQAILIVVDGETPEQTRQVLAYLGDCLERDAEHVVSYYIPGEGPYFERHGLLYLNLEDLQQLAANLAHAQPFIGRLSRDNSLNGLLSVIGLAITATDIELPVDLAPLLTEIRNALQATLNGRHYLLSWQQLMFGQAQDLLTNRRFILVKPILDYAALMPAETSLLAVRAIADDAQQRFPGARVRLTGEITLEHDELESVSRSAAIASLVSLILVCTVLMLGLRSPAMTFATFVCMVIGLIFTAAFAALSVGRVNLISIAFAVLYIGLAVDYAIHFCLRYRELLRRKIDRASALNQTLASVGPSIALCAVTTAAGFYAFVPTAYAGVSELGIIAGSGMMIGLLVTLTLLPAMLKVLPLALAEKSRGIAFPDRFYRFPMAHRKLIRRLSYLLAIGAAVLLTQVRFDFNPINLRDPALESVSTFKELLTTKETSPMTLTILAPNKTEALQTAARLKQLDAVEAAVTIFDFIPDKQDEKLAVIEELALILGLRTTRFPPPRANPAERHIDALEGFDQAIRARLQSRPDGPLATLLAGLEEDIGQLLNRLESLPPAEQQALTDRLQASLLDALPDTMNLLLSGLQAGPVTLDQLPPELLRRWLSEDGIYRIMTYPAKDLNDFENLKAFVTEVQQVAPHATDLPAIYLATGREVVKAFQQALIGAFAAITLILLLVQRNLRDTVLVLIPLLLAATLTGAATVLLDTPFNFANIIAVPLLFGMGVDSGIHIIHRLRHMRPGDTSLLRTSTARGVFFSGLTTLCGFVSLAFVPHLGLASMGLLLAIGISLIVFCSLVVLPAFAGGDFRGE